MFLQLSLTQMELVNGAPIMVAALMMKQIILQEMLPQIYMWLEKQIQFPELQQRERIKQVSVQAQMHLL